MSHTFDFYMGDSILTTTYKHKYLGAINDDKITWIPLITYVENKVSKSICIMFKERHNLKRNASLTCTIRLYTLI